MHDARASPFLTTALSLVPAEPCAAESPAGFAPVLGLREHCTQSDAALAAAGQCGQGLPIAAVPPSAQPTL